MELHYTEDPRRVRWDRRGADMGTRTPDDIRKTLTTQGQSKPQDPKASDLAKLKTQGK